MCDISLINYLAFLIVIMRFRSKTYWGSLELDDRNTCIQRRKIWNKENDQFNKKWNNIVVVI
jgi:hypothetical protein